MSVIIIDEAIIHYEALGRGRPIVFLHGWVGSWRYWMPSMQVASTSYRAYALDFFGYGDTTHDPSSYALEKQAALLARFRAEMGIGKIAIVGHGLGALVGFLFAAQEPDSVDRIMAVSSPLDASALNARLKTGTPAELVEWLAGRTPDSEDALAEAAKTDPRAVAASMTSFQANGLFSQVRDAHVPCLLVYGQNDPCLRVPSLDNTQALGMSVHQINLANSGHFPMLDEAARFNRLLTDFLALAPGLSPRQLQLKDEWKRRVR